PHRPPLLSANHHSASRTLTTNQPSVTGASPEPESSSRASATTRFSQPKAGLVVYARRATPGGSMRFLLTSSGITNTSIHDALVDLLGKPIAESSALCIPTATYAFPGGAASAYRLIAGSAASPLCELGWKSLGVLELTALPSIDEEHWIPVVQETDALLVG